MKRAKILLGLSVFLALASVAVMFDNSGSSWVWARTPWFGLFFLVPGLVLLAAGVASWRRESTRGQ